MDPYVLIQVVFMHTIDVVIRTCNVVYIHVILYEWQLSLTNIYERINTKMSCPQTCLVHTLNYKNFLRGQNKMYNDFISKNFNSQ